jgi:hypothetical protein
MAVTVLETISRGDLSLYREYAGMDQGIQHAGEREAMTPQEIRDFYIKFWGFVEELMERYGIEGAEAEECKISTFTGQIYVGSED